MQGKPTDATHSIDVISMQQDTPGAMRLKDLINQPDAAHATMTCDVCGTIVLVPDGSLRNHLIRRASDLGGDEAYVGYEFTHHWNTPQPVGTGIALISKRLGRELIHIDNIGDDVEVYRNPDPTKPPEQQAERFRLKDILKWTKNSRRGRRK